MKSYELQVAERIFNKCQDHSIDETNSSVTYHGVFENNKVTLVVSVVEPDGLIKRAMHTPMNSIEVFINGSLSFTCTLMKKDFMALIYKLDDIKTKLKKKELSDAAEFFSENFE